MAKPPPSPLSRNFSPRSSDEAIPVYPVRGADASRGGCGRGRNPRRSWHKGSFGNDESRQKRSRGRRGGSSRVLEMHGVGRHRAPVDSRRRYPFVAGLRPGRWTGGDGQLLVCPDQRQPHRVRQGPVQEDRDRHAPGGRGPDQRLAATTRLPDPHRRPHPPRDPQGVRHRLRDPQGGQGRQDLLRARRARCHSATARNT